MNRQLLLDSALYTVANLGSRLASLGALALLPLLLDVQDYGVIGLVAAVAAFVNIIVPFEISQGLARFYASTPSHEQAIVAGTAWWFTAIMLSIAAGLAMLLSKPLSRLIFGSADYQVVLGLSVAFWLGNTAFLFLQNQFRWSFRPREYTIFSITYAVLMLGSAVALAALSNWPLIGALGGWACAALAVSSLAFWSLRRSLPLRISGLHLKQMLRYSLPLVPASLAIVITTYISRLIISSRLGLSEVGLFTFASQLAAIPSFVVLGLQSAVTPHVMASYERPETPVLLARVFEVVLIAGLTASFTIALLCDSVLPMVGYAAYSGSGTLVLFLGPALLFQQLYIFAPGFAISRRTGLQALVCIASGGVAIFLNYLLVERWGTIGAAAATLVAASMFLALWFGLAHRHYPIPVRWRAIAAIGFSLSAASQLDAIAATDMGPLPALAALSIVLLAAAPIWWPTITALRLRGSDGV